MKAQIENEAVVFSGVQQTLELEARWQLVALWRPLWLYRKTVARTAAYFALATLIVMLCVPSEFDSTVQIMPPESANTANLALMSSAGAGTAALASNLLGLKSSGSLFVAMLQSRTVLDGIINRLDLRGVYSVSTYLRARKILVGRSSISEDRKSGIVSVTVRDRDAKRAASIANAYVDELNSVLARSSTSAARRERIFLEDRLKAVKQELDDSQQRFSDFASTKGAIDIKEQAHAMVNAAAQLQGELIATESEERGLEQIYSANNVRVRSVQARIAELKQQLKKLGGVPEGSNSSDPSRDDLAYPSMRELPILGVKWADLYRQTVIDEAVFETLTKQYELAKVQEAKEIPVAQVFDDPIPAEKKSYPHRALVTLGGAAVGFIFGALFVIAREAWKQRGHDDPVKMFASEIWQDSGSFLARIGSRRHRDGESDLRHNGG